MPDKEFDKLSEGIGEIPIPDIVPVLPLKDMVVFPYIIVPLSVSREKSINAVDAALAEQRVIMLTLQKQNDNETPGAAELHEIGTLAAIMRMLKLPDGRIRLLVQGVSRARINSFLQSEPYFRAKVTRIPEPESAKKLAPEEEALVRGVKQNLERSVTLGKNISPEVMLIAANLEDTARLADLAASNMELKSEQAQRVLETVESIPRLRLVNDEILKEINVLTMQQEITSQARGEMDKSQRELPATAVEGHPAGTRQRGGAVRGDRELPGARRRQETLRGGGQRGREADQASRAEPPGLRRDGDHPHLPRLDDRASLVPVLDRRVGSRSRPPDPRR
jgi:ATP-dependent Lon protease